MEPRLVRVDERLVHGQVVVAWMRHLSCNSVCIVDDEVSGDPYLQEVFKVALGSVGRLVVCSSAEAAARWDGCRDSMVLLRSPVLAARLFQEGAGFSRLNVGGLGNRTGRTRLYPGVYASAEELRSLRALRDQGVQVYYQAVPGQEAVDLTEQIYASSRAWEEVT